MKKAVCALIPILGMILTVSRKDDHTKFGLIGGKVDSNETLTDALKRETLEETGLHIVIEDHPPFIDSIDDFEVHTFLVSLDDKYHESIDVKETGLIKLHNKSDLLNSKNSPFYVYNEKAFKHFGI